MREASIEVSVRVQALAGRCALQRQHLQRRHQFGAELMPRRIVARGHLHGHGVVQQGLGIEAFGVGHCGGDVLARQQAGCDQWSGFRHD